jgi:nitrous oxidase accessory protein NosD
MASVIKKIRFALLSVLLLCAMATQTGAATITVTNTNDSGPGSLRQAIINASPGDTINFAPSITTVILTSGELVIDKNLTITGPGANRLTVQVNANVISVRVFNISSTTCTLAPRMVQLCRWAGAWSHLE